MQLGLEEKNVLITGSSRGIGRGIAEEFLKEKANTILTGRNQKDLTNTYQEFSRIYGEDRVHKFNGDLTSENIIDDILFSLKNDSINLDHIVCNIGSGKSVIPLDEDSNEFKRILEINLLTAVNVVSKLYPIMKKVNPKTNSYPGITFIGSICESRFLAAS